VTEKSQIWDSGGGGDASPHSEADTANLFKALMGATSANKGVVPGMLNELICTVSGGNILTNTGYAIVDGHPYLNDASKSTAIATPSVGTTGGRIVLRASWSAQTVRVTEIRSADGTATIPAMTQTPGTTYDIPLCSFTITTGGTITITADTREFPGNVFDTLRQMWRTPGRRLVAWATAGMNIGSAVTDEGYGIGAAASYSGGGSGLVQGGGAEPSLSFSSNASTTSYIGRNSAAAGPAPNKSPRMLTRLYPGASHASMTVFIAGFGNGLGATVNGAYLRVATTGNLFFVTRQGGAETTTDLGTRPSVLTSYEIETVDGGVTWTCRNQNTGVVVATHTTNVPTATVGLDLYFYAESLAGAAGSAGQWAYGFCEATFAHV